MRVKVQYRSASSEAYEAFCRDYPKLVIPKDVWRALLQEINYTYRDYILQTGEKLRLPHGFGDLSINKKKNKRTRIDPKDGKEKICMPIDWAATKKKGKRVYNFNSHTEGYYFGWVYFSDSSRIIYPHLWRFKASRTSSRLLGKYLKDPDHTYQHMYREWT